MTPPASADVTVAAALVREGLGLTAHQLGELTAALGLDVGPRANYPRYDFTGSHLLLGVKTLRDARVPLDVAMTAVATYREPIAIAQGWMLCMPGSPRWLSAVTLSSDDLTGWLRAAGGCGIVLDLAALADHSATRWQMLTITTIADSG